MRYNSPFIKMLEALANMFIVSFLWTVFSLPVVTIIPSSAALFHTVNKVVFGEKKGHGVLKDYFASFRENLKTGCLLSLIFIVAFLFILEGLWTGLQIYKLSLWGTVYLVMGVVFALLFLLTIIHVPPVLSYFDAPLSSILRMAVYFAIAKPLRSIIFIIFLVFMIVSVWFFPLALFVVPALYTDLIRPYLTRDFDRFIKENEVLNA